MQENIQKDEGSVSQRKSDPWGETIFLLIIATIMSAIFTPLLWLVAWLAGEPQGIVALVAIGPYAIVSAFIWNNWKMHRMGFVIPLQFGPQPKKKQ